MRLSGNHEHELSVEVTRRHFQQWRNGKVTPQVLLLLFTKHYCRSAKGENVRWTKQSTRSKSQNQVLYSGPSSFQHQNSKSSPKHLKCDLLMIFSTQIYGQHPFYWPLMTLIDGCLALISSFMHLSFQHLVIDLRKGSTMQEWKVKTSLFWEARYVNSFRSSQLNALLTYTACNSTLICRFIHVSLVTWNFIHAIIIWFSLVQI